MNRREEVRARVELLLVPDCRHAETTRAVLTESSSLLGSPIAVQERVGDYPSPTVLVDGVDVVTGQVFEPGAAACRRVLPTVSDVVTALMAAAGQEGDELNADRYPPGLAVGTTSDRIGRVSPQARRLHRVVLRHFARTGAPPSRAALGALAPGCDTDAVLSELHEHDVIRLGEAGGIRAAYPFSGVPTAHQVRIDGGATVYAMCAVDALGMAAMLDRVVVIRSVDPGDQTEVRVTVAPAGDTSWAPATTVVFVGSTGPSVPERSVAVLSKAAAQPCCEASGVAIAAADRCCGVMNFFASAETASRWLRAHPEVHGDLLTQRQAWRLGVDIFGHLLHD